MKPLALFAAFAVVAAASAQLPDGPTVSAKIDAKTAKVGATVKGVVTITFAEGLHGYQNPPTDEYQIPVKVELADKAFKLIKVAYPKGVEAIMAGSKANVYKGTIQIPVTLKVVSAKPGVAHLSFRVNYQQCNEATCFPPSSVVAKADLKVVKK